MYTEEQIKEIMRDGLYRQYSKVIKNRLLDARIMLENAGDDSFEHFNKSIEAAKDHISKAEQIYYLMEEIDKANHPF